LTWSPRLNIGDTLAWSADWYRAHAAGENMLMYSQRQIGHYQSLPHLNAPVNSP
jgi:CDP-glucose 4,6-dehydratase